MVDHRHLLEVEELSVRFPSRRGEVAAVGGLSYYVDPGEIVGIVGESGSGKSVEAMAVMRLLKKPGKVTGGRVLLDGRDMVTLSERDMESLRGRDISMIFQDPMSCLDPLFPVGMQLTETILAHEQVSAAEARMRAEKALMDVGIADGRRIMKQYPYALSGGMRQRVMIAMAMLCSPRLLIADEPTTSLDVTIQAQILEILRRMREEKNTAIVFITHNFGVVADLCDRVYVMYGGMVMEEGPVDLLFREPVHPYTVGLLGAIPRLDGDRGQRLIPVEGRPIDPTRVPPGCVFSQRCPHCMRQCEVSRPPKMDLGGGHSASCWLLRDL